MGGGWSFWQHSPLEWRHLEVVEHNSGLKRVCLDTIVRYLLPVLKQNCEWQLCGKVFLDVCKWWFPLHNSLLCLLHNETGDLAAQRPVKQPPRSRRIGYREWRGSKLDALPWTFLTIPSRKFMSWQPCGHEHASLCSSSTYGYFVRMRTVTPYSCSPASATSCLPSSQQRGKSPWELFRHLTKLPSHSKTISSVRLLLQKVNSWKWQSLCKCWCFLATRVVDAGWKKS